MSDTQPSQRAVTGPEYHDTTEMPAVKVPSSALDAVLTELRALRSEQQDTRTELKADIQLVANDLGIVKERVRLVERRQDDADERAKNNSIRVKANTEDDAKQDQAIAMLVTKVDGLEKTQAAQLAILERLDKIAANPMVRRVAYAVATAALGYLAAKGYLR